MSGKPAPTLLPTSSLAPKSDKWTPRQHQLPLKPPPMDEARIQEQELLAQNKQFLDGKMIKKTRPRRTVDYNGGLGRWTLVSCVLCSICLLELIRVQLKKLRPNTRYTPYLRPALPFIVDVRRLLSTSYCTTEFLVFSCYPLALILTTPRRLFAQSLYIRPQIKFDAQSTSSRLVSLRMPTFVIGVKAKEPGSLFFCPVDP
jgi:hypothetical protein